jgi:hypothetical protein
MRRIRILNAALRILGCYRERVAPNGLDVRMLRHYVQDKPEGLLEPDSLACYVINTELSRNAARHAR